MTRTMMVKRNSHATRSKEVNMLSCLMAVKLNKSKRSVTCRTAMIRIVNTFNFSTVQLCPWNYIKGDS